MAHPIFYPKNSLCTSLIFCFRGKIKGLAVKSSLNTHAKQRQKKKNVENVTFP